MASITQIGASWRVLIRRKGVYECQTFQTKSRAQAWARQREAEIDSGRIVADTSKVKVSSLIQTYREMRDQSRPIEATSNTHYMLKRLDEGLGHLLVAKMQISDLVDYCRVRADEGAGAYTCNMEISQLSTVIRYAASFTNQVFPDVVGQARPLLTHLNLIGAGKKRERRTTEDECLRIVEELAKRHNPVYAEAFLFSIASTMRRGEICSIKWDDLDEQRQMVMIRNRKHPRQKEGNDEWVPLLGDAWKIVKRQPKEDDRIFPIHPQTLSKYFKEAREAQGIGDLRLHDMRHEGTSRLFEQGYAIQQVALVTGHKKWETLKRYTNLKPESLTAKKTKRRVA